MNIATSGIGNNPTMDSRATFNRVAVAKEISVPKIPKIAKDDTRQSTATEIESMVVQNVSANELRYNVNEKLEQVVVTIVDPTTNKVIKEIPSTEMQQMKIRVKDTIGSFIDETR